MNSTEVFLVDNRLRPIWRFLLSVVLLFFAFIVAAEIVGVIFLQREGPSQFVCRSFLAIPRNVVSSHHFIQANDGSFRPTASGFSGLGVSPSLVAGTGPWTDGGRGHAIRCDGAGGGLRIRPLLLFSAPDGALGILRLRRFRLGRGQ